MELFKNPTIDFKKFYHTVTFQVKITKSEFF